MEIQRYFVVFSDLLTQPANILCKYSKILPNNAQKMDSIMYEIYVYKLCQLPELNTLKLFLCFKMP